MTTLNLQVAASADDGVQSGAGTNAITGTTARLRDTGGGIGIIYVMQRWAVAIPQGTTITSATLSMYVTTHSDDLYADVAAQSIDNAPAFNTTANDISGRTCGTISNWSVASASITDSAYITKDVTSMVQTVLNRAGWVSGNYLAIRLYNDTLNACDVTFQMYDGDSTKAPKLDIVYSGGAVGATFVNAKKMMLGYHI